MSDHDATTIVLASGSRYRAALLAEAGIAAEIDPPDVDERAADHLLHDEGAAALALELARRKAAAVLPRHPGRIVVAGDQVGVLTASDGTEVQLTKRPTVEGAVEQLTSLAGTTHRLVNGLVVAADGRFHEGVDVQVVTMRPFTVDEARSYVERFEPFDTAGSYRLEDQDGMADGEGFVLSVEGEDRSGVLGLPMPLLHRLLDAAGWSPR